MGHLNHSKGYLIAIGNNYRGADTIGQRLAREMQRDDANATPAGRGEQWEHRHLTANEQDLIAQYLKNNKITECPTQYNYGVSVRSKLNERHLEDSDEAIYTVSTPRVNEDYTILWGCWQWYNAIKLNEKLLMMELMKSNPDFKVRVKKFKQLLKRKARIKACKSNKSWARKTRAKRDPIKLPSQNK